MLWYIYFYHHTTSFPVQYLSSFHPRDPANEVDHRTAKLVLSYRRQHPMDMCKANTGWHELPVYHLSGKSCLTLDTSAVTCSMRNLEHLCKALLQLSDKFKLNKGRMIKCFLTELGLDGKENIKGKQSFCMDFTALGLYVVTLSQKFSHTASPLS